MAQYNSMAPRQRLTGVTQPAQRRLTPFARARQARNMAKTSGRARRDQQRQMRQMSRMQNRRSPFADRGQIGSPRPMAPDLGRAYATGAKKTMAPMQDMGSAYATGAKEAMAPRPQIGRDRAQPFQQRQAAMQGQLGGNRMASAGKDLRAASTRQGMQYASQASGFQGNTARRETPFAGGMRK